MDQQRLCALGRHGHQHAGTATSSGRSVTQYGDPRIPDRIWTKISPAPISGCWVWSGTTVSSHGLTYGRVSVQGRMLLVHRAVYTVLVSDPGKSDLDHTCRTTLCCNPKHLEPVTHAENVTRGYHARGVCRNGHDLSGYNLITVGHVRCRICRTERRRRYRASLASQPALDGQ